MTSTAKAILAYLAIALIVFAWMFRFDVKVAGANVFDAYILDRWTGTVQFCGITAGGTCHNVYPPVAAKN
jgi:hypothetical protein